MLELLVDSNALEARDAVDNGSSIIDIREVMLVSICSINVLEIEFMLPD